MNKENNNIFIGEIGEKIAESFLKKKGFLIIDKNVNKKCGELDIVAQDKKTK